MASFNQKMWSYGSDSSVIRELRLKAEARAERFGEDSVCDFTIGNPCTPVPESVRSGMRRLLTEEDPVKVHGYTAIAGDPPVREKVAASLRARFGARISMRHIFMTSGAAASLTLSLHALIEPGDEVLCPAPFFPEYAVYAEKAGAVFRPLPADEETFEINLPALEQAVCEKTRVLILNSPNNPTGVILKRGTLERIAAILRHKSAAYGHPVFILSDEPYRELVYTGEEVPYIPSIYPDTLICYSFSKSLSMPGDRIGYIALPDDLQDADGIFLAISGAARALGYLCAPSFMQYAVADHLDETCDLELYRVNRALFYEALRSFGYTVVKPDGAFYLFVKSPDPDANAFAARLAKDGVYVVPSDSFGLSGYVRIAYCVPTEVVRRSLPVFEKVIRLY